MAVEMLPGVLCIKKSNTRPVYDTPSTERDILQFLFGGVQELRQRAIVA